MSQEHPGPTGVHAPDLVKVHFPLSPQDRSQGVEAENLWAMKLGRDKFKLDNIPFYVYGVSSGDIVTAEMADGRLVFRRVVERGGHSTYRLLVKDEAGFESEHFKRLRVQLEKLGCSYEVAKRRWIAVDVPPDTDVFAVYKLLESGEGAGDWDFEEGHCGHATDR